MYDRPRYEVGMIRQTGESGFLDYQVICVKAAVSLYLVYIPDHAA